MNPGNSGGPVLDTKGNVIGIADRKEVMTAVKGLNFAVSADAATQLLSVARDPATLPFVPLARCLSIV
jgi:S1-C subfamily serine protease